MPSLAAAVVASLVSWVIDAMIEAYVGISARIFISLTISAFVYVYARKWLIELRGR